MPASEGTAYPWCSVERNVSNRIREAPALRGPEDPGAKEAPRTIAE
jgi:hypothetical protein